MKKTLEKHSKTASGGVLLSPGENSAKPFPKAGSPSWAHRLSWSHPETWDPVESKAKNQFMDTDESWHPWSDCAFQRASPRGKRCRRVTQLKWWLLKGLLVPRAWPQSMAPLLSGFGPSNTAVAGGRGGMEMMGLNWNQHVFTPTNGSTDTEQHDRRRHLQAARLAPGCGSHTRPTFLGTSSGQRAFSPDPRYL